MHYRQLIFLFLFLNAWTSLPVDPTIDKGYIMTKSTIKILENMDLIKVTVDPTCLPSSLPPGRFDCKDYGPESPQTAVYVCPKFNCVNDDYEFAEGQCCRISFQSDNWEFCWSQNQSVLTNKITDNMGLAECPIKSHCTVETQVMTEWRGEGCCLDLSANYERTCCIDTNIDSSIVTCWPQPVRQPDPVLCEYVKCDSTYCYIKGGGQNQCCEHMTANGKQICCIVNPQPESTDAPWIPGNITIPGIDKPLNCSPFYQQEPDRFQCPPFSCENKPMRIPGVQKLGDCCSFSFMGTSWKCCKGSGCIRTFNITDLEKCKETRCKIRKSYIDEFRRNGCCEDKTPSKTFTCCLGKAADDRPYIHCVPKAAKKADAYTCDVMQEEDPRDICKKLTEQNRICCKRNDTGIKETCCLDYCPAFPHIKNVKTERTIQISTSSTTTN